LIQLTRIYIEIMTGNMNMAAELRRGVINVVVLVILAGFLITIFQAASAKSDENTPDKLVENSKMGAVEVKAREAMETIEKTVEGAGIASWNKVKRLATLATDKLPEAFSFKKTAAPASQVVSFKKTATPASQVVSFKKTATPASQVVSFKKTAAPASQYDLDRYIIRDSHGTAKTVKETVTKGYEIGKKATQDVIENAGQAAQKTGEKIKQTVREL